MARLSQGCSSRRTISSPVRAVDRQCTRRRSSPRRYSRVAASSSPCTATERARLSPVPAHSPASRTAGSATTCGMTVSRSTLGKERVSSQSPNGSVSRITQRADRVPAAHVGADRVRDRAGLVRAEPLEHHPGPAAQRVRQPVLQQQRAGGQPGQVLQPQQHPRAGADRDPVRVQRPVAGQPVAGCAPRRRRPAAAGRRAAPRPAAGPARRGAARRRPPPARRPGRTARGWSAPAVPRASPHRPPGRGRAVSVALGGPAGGGQGRGARTTGTRRTSSATIASVCAGRAGRRRSG